MTFTDNIGMFRSYAKVLPSMEALNDQLTTAIREKLPDFGKSVRLYYESFGDDWTNISITSEFSSGDEIKLSQALAIVLPVPEIGTKRLRFQAPSSATGSCAIPDEEWYMSITETWDHKPDVAFVYRNTEVERGRFSIWMRSFPLPSYMRLLKEPMAKAIERVEGDAMEAFKRVHQKMLVSGPRSLSLCKGATSYDNDEDQ